MMLRSALVIFSGNGMIAAVNMIRTLIVARLVSVEDFGIASTFLLAMAIVEMMSALGLKQQLIQSRDGDDPHLQAALQGFQAIRGATNFVLLVALSFPLALFFGIPDVAWGYQVIALVPLLTGFGHFDNARNNRQMRFGPAVMTGFVPAVLSTLSVVPLFWVFGDWRVILFALLLQSIVGLLVSHLIAQRPYRLAFDLAIIRKSLSFGWPLMVNGVLMFLVFNGERAIVGRELGMIELGLFSIAYSLALAPTLVLANSTMSFFLPQLSAATEPERFSHLAMATFQAHMLFGGTLVVAVAILGAPFLHVALGPAYEGAIPLLTWLGIMQAIRLTKGGSSCVAMSRAETKNAMAANILRVLLLPVAWWVLIEGGSVLTVIWICIAGEALGLVVSLFLAMWRIRLSLRPLMLPYAMQAVLLAVAAVHATGQADATDWTPDPVTSGALLVVLALSLVTMRDLRRYIARRTMTRHRETDRD